MSTEEMKMINCTGCAEMVYQGGVTGMGPDGHEYCNCCLRQGFTERPACEAMYVRDVETHSGPNGALYCKGCVVAWLEDRCYCCNNAWGVEERVMCQECFNEDEEEKREKERKKEAAKKRGPPPVMQGTYDLADLKGDLLDQAFMQVDTATLS